MTTYNVYQRETLDQTPVQIATGLTSKNYAVSGLTKGKKYLFSIGAVKSGLEKISGEKLVLAGIEWTPLLISPAFLLDDESNFTLEGNLVTLWGSRSSSYFFGQSTQSYKPLLVNNGLNERKIIRFDGVNDILFNNTSALRSVTSNKQYISFFAVVKRNSGNGVLSAITNNSGGSRFTIGMSSTALNTYARRLDADSESSRSKSVAGGWLMIFQKIDFSTRTLETHINGLLVESVSSFVTSGSTSNTLSDRPLSIGGFPNGTGDNPASGANLGIDLASYFLLNNSILQSDIDKCFGYAAHKYGLTNNLPTDHPYKTLIPTV